MLGQVGPQALVNFGFPPRRNGEPLEGVEQSRGVSSMDSFRVLLWLWVENGREEGKVGTRESSWQEMRWGIGQGRVASGLLGSRTVPCQILDIGHRGALGMSHDPTLFITIVHI